MGHVELEQPQLLRRAERAGPVHGVEEDDGQAAAEAGLEHVPEAHAEEEVLVLGGAAEQPREGARVRGGVQLVEGVDGRVGRVGREEVVDGYERLLRTG